VTFTSRLRIRSAKRGAESHHAANPRAARVHPPSLRAASLRAANLGAANLRAANLRAASVIRACLLALALAGCGVTPVAPNVDTPGMPNAEVALQKSMDQTAQELARISAMQPSAAVAAKPTVVAGELDRVVSMSWNGALDGAVTKLADTIGYRAVVTGAAPQAGVNVSVDPKPRRVFDILQGLGDQAGESATVRVDQQHQLLEVIYHG
jgi:hypothetical protein